MITKGTIEEKIDELKLKKRNLIEDMIQPGETWLNKNEQSRADEIIHGLRRRQVIKPIKTFNGLSNTEIYEILKLRNEVFVVGAKLRLSRL